MQKLTFIPNATFRIYERRRQTFLVTLCRLFMSFLYFSRVSLVAGDDCPVEINPQRVVVRYGSSVSVDCSTNVTHYGMGWEASEGPVPMTTDKLVTWRVSNLRHWEIEPQCFINYDKEQCEVYLQITVYKTPDSVSISTIDHTGPMTENTQYQLQCDIVNVAPVKNLIVKWYKGETLVYQETFTDNIKTPVSKTSTLQITPDGADNGVQYRCEAELDLGADGPRPPTVTSDHIQITVLYKPKHKVMNEIITADEGVILNCTVAANPPAAYVWHSDHLKETRSSSVLSSSTLSPGNYTCTATNSLGRSSLTFTLRSGGRGTFWAILLSGLGVLVLLIISYTIYKCTCSKNSVI